MLKRGIDYSFALGLVLSLFGWAALMYVIELIKRVQKSEPGVCPNCHRASGMRPIAWYGQDVEAWYCQACMPR